MIADESRHSAASLSCGAPSRLFLVPRSWDKTEYKDAVRNISERALHELAHATRICFVGCSLPETDAYFQSLLTVALSRNQNLRKITVVDFISPGVTGSAGANAGHIETTEERYRRLFAPAFAEKRPHFFTDGMRGFFRGRQSLEELERGDMITTISVASS
jgi:hypothetical protein